MSSKARAVTDADWRTRDHAAAVTAFHAETQSDVIECVKRMVPALR